MMIHNAILRWTIAICDALMAFGLVLLVANQPDYGAEFYRMPLLIMLVGIIAAAYAFDHT